MRAAHGGDSPSTATAADRPWARSVDFDYWAYVHQALAGEISYRDLGFQLGIKLGSRVPLGHYSKPLECLELSNPEVAEWVALVDQLHDGRERVHVWLKTHLALYLEPVPADQLPDFVAGVTEGLIARRDAALAIRSLQRETHGNGELSVCRVYFDLGYSFARRDQWADRCDGSLGDAIAMERGDSSLFGRVESFLDRHLPGVLGSIPALARVPFLAGFYMSASGAGKSLAGRVQKENLGWIGGPTWFEK